MLTNQETLQYVNDDSLGQLQAGPAQKFSMSAQVFMYVIFNHLTMGQLFDSYKVSLPSIEFNIHGMKGQFGWHMGLL